MLLGLATAAAGWRWLGPPDGTGDDRGEEAVRDAGAARGIDPRRAEFEALARDLPEGLWLDRLVERDKEIVLCGRADDLGGIADWIERLDRARIFADVELRQVTGRHLDPSLAEPGYSFIIGLTDLPARRSRRGTRRPSGSPAGSAASRIECTAAATDSMGLDRLPVLEPSSPAPAPLSATWLASARVEELEIVGVYRTSLGPVARARSPRHDGVLAIQVGDLLNDSEVTWIGFLPERRAAVRLKQLVWPPKEGETYREIQRVVDPGTEWSGR